MGTNIEAAEERIFICQLHEVLERAMDRLTPDQRCALKLHYYFQLSLEDVGGMMGCSKQNVVSLVDAGLRRIRTGPYLPKLKAFLHPDLYDLAWDTENSSISFRLHAMNPTDAFLIRGGKAAWISKK